MAAIDPEKSYRRTMLTVAGLAIAIVLFMVGIAGIPTWQKYRHTQNWTPVTATVEEHVTRCRVERKNNKNWSLQQVTDCTEARRIVQEKDSFLTPYRSSEVRYATISYGASGNPIRKEIPVHAFAGADGAPGSTFRIYVDPADSNAIDEPWTSDEMNIFWAMTAVGLCVGLFVMAIGWWVATATRRHARKRQAAAAHLAAQDARG